MLTWIGENFDRYGDIFAASIYGSKAYVTRDPAHAQQVLQTNWKAYKKGQLIKRIGLLLGNGLMVSEGRLWKQQRQMVQPAFVPRVIDKMTEAMGKANLALLEKWRQAAQAKQPVNITFDISLMVLGVVLLAIFGDDYDEIMPHFSILSEEAARDLGFAQAFAKRAEVILRLCTRRRQQIRPAEDILGMLMAARTRDSGEPMPDGQLIREIMTLIVAGHETTASTLSLTWYMLGTHSEAEAKLRSELDRFSTNLPLTLARLPDFPYAGHVIEEVMRLYPAGWLMTRRALSDDQLGAYFVPKGTEIYIPPYFIHRHPGFWEAPDAFNPDRFEDLGDPAGREAALLPFSAGPRNCVGESLARAEMLIHLILLGSKIRFRFDPRTALEFEADVNLRAKHALIAVPELLD